MLGAQSTPLLALLRRLEAQNIWRMSYNVLGSQQYSAASAAEAAAGARKRERRDRPLASRRPAAGVQTLAPWPAAAPHAAAWATGTPLAPPAEPCAATRCCRRPTRPLRSLSGTHLPCPTLCRAGSGLV